MTYKVMYALGNSDLTEMVGKFIEFGKYDDLNTAKQIKQKLLDEHPNYKYVEIWDSENNAIELTLDF